jgi:hypothetical protein
MSIIQVLGSPFKGAGATSPKLPKYDSMETSGSLLLIDPTHPYKQWSSGAPSVENAAIPNVLADKFSQLTGVSTGVDASWHSANITANIKFERTGKGGLHGYLKQTSITTERGGIYVPTAIMNYMNANKSHAFYISLWQRTTQASTYTPSGNYNPTYSAMAANTGAGNLLYGFNIYQVVANNGGKSYLSTAGISATNHLYATYTIPNAYSTDLTDFRTLPWYVGTYGPWNGATGITPTVVDKLPSQILYRYYIEDLTVSGRTYEQVLALDQALYTKEVITAGGRYYGDTFTDPVTATF